MRKRKPTHRDRARKQKRSGRQARAGQQTLRSEKIGALPILNHFLRRLRLEEWLQRHLPPENSRVKIPAAMAREGLESLPLCTEERPCRRPTARRVIDLFDDIQCHTLVDDSEVPTVFATELTDLQRRILELLGVPTSEYLG